MAVLVTGQCSCYLWLTLISHLQSRVSLATNSLWLECKSKGMYQYSVHFFPNVDSKEMRYKLLYDQHNEALPEPRKFDGATLVLLTKLPTDVRTRNFKLNSLIIIGLT